MANIGLLNGKKFDWHYEHLCIPGRFPITVSICLDALAHMYVSEIDARIGAHHVTLLQIIHGSYEHGAVDDRAP